MNGRIVYGAIASPLGTFYLAAGEQGLVRAGTAETEGAFVDEIARAGGWPDYAPDELDGAASQLEEYFAGGRREFDLDVDLSDLSPFQQAVLKAVAAVPHGEVRSYRDIARAIGKPLAARAVGGAVAINPVSIVIPCHRIIKSDGSPGYYALAAQGPERGVGRKLRLLAMEGVVFGKDAGL